MDGDCAILTQMLANRQAFSYWRFGDGALECMFNRLGKTADGEVYSEAMGADLRSAINALTRKRLDNASVMIGDWATATNGSAPNYVDVWNGLFGDVPASRLVHFEALLLNRRSKELFEFYRAVKEDDRRKVILGAPDNVDALDMLRSAYVCAPIVPYQRLDVLISTVAKIPFDVLLFGAGMAGLLVAFWFWQRHPERTYIHLGSALDPLWRGNTRGGQLSKASARDFLKELL